MKLLVERLVQPDRHRRRDRGLRRLTAVARDSLSVGAVTCAVPEDLDVSDLVVGDTVLVFCSLVDGVLTAGELELDEPWLDDEPFDEEDGEDDLP